MNPGENEAKWGNRMKWKVMSMEEAPFIRALFQMLDGLADVDHHVPDRQRLEEAIADYDIYFCSLKVRVDRRVIDRARRLKAIVTPSTGLDHIDVDYAAARGIAIISLKGDREFLDSVTATAELGWGLLLGAIRNIPWGYADVLRGEWPRDRYRGMQLSGKTLGVLGYGRLGTMTAQYGKAFRMRVIACDVRPVADEGIEQVDFDTLLRRSDVLSIHLHLTPETRGIIDEAAFDRMKDGIVIVNTSRGAIIDEAAFLKALENGKVASAGLDVIDGEWSDRLQDHPLIRFAREHGRLLISPHIGGITYESNEAAFRRSIGKLKAFLENQRKEGIDP